MLLGADEVQSDRRYEPFSVSYGAIHMIVHYGTHVDAPAFIQRRGSRNTHQRAKHVDQLDLNQLVGEACVVDIPKHGAANIDYQITINDLRAWEKVCADMCSTAQAKMCAGARSAHRQLLRDRAHGPESLLARSRPIHGRTT